MHPGRLGFKLLFDNKLVNPGRLCYPINMFLEFLLGDGVVTHEAFIYSNQVLTSHSDPINITQMA